MTQSLALLTPDMSAAERQLILAAVRGAVADLGGEAVRGAVLRDLLDGARPGWQVHRTGLRLRNARITGGLDLERFSLDLPVLLSGVAIDSDGVREALLLADARLTRLSLHECRLDGALIADRASFTAGLDLDGCIAIGPVHLRGAKIAGPLTAQGAQLGDGVTALIGDAVDVSGALVLREARLNGAVQLLRAVLGGGLCADGATIVIASPAAPDADHDRPPALLLDGARVAGDVELSGMEANSALSLQSARVDGRLTVAGARLGGGLDLAGALISQQLVAREARLEGTLGLAGASVAGGIVGDRLEVHAGRVSLAGARARIGGDVALEEAKLVGTLDWRGARIDGELRLRASRLFGAGDSFAGDGLQARAGVSFEKAVVFGTVRLPAARIAQCLSFAGASLKVDRGAAVSADHLTIGRDLLFVSGLRTIGGIDLTGARISGNLDFSDSQVTALRLAGDLPERRPGQQAASRQSERERHATDLAIGFSDGRAARLIMPRRAENRPRGIVDLSRAHVAALEDYREAWPAPVDLRLAVPGGRDCDHLVLKGFVYDQLVNPAGQALREEKPAKGAARFEGPAAPRIAWLEAQPVADVAQQFAPQAWRVLADRLAAQGFAADARRIEVARCRWQARSLTTTRAGRFAARLFDLIALYGYGPWRTVACLLATIVVFAGVYHWGARPCDGQGCGPTGVFVARDHADADRPPFNPMIYSLETALPVLNLGGRDTWTIASRKDTQSGRRAAGLEPRPMVAPDAGEARPAAPAAIEGLRSWLVPGFTRAGIMQLARIIETLLGVVLALLAIAGFAGVLRK